MINIAIPRPVKYRVGRGLTANLPSNCIDGFIWFTTDTGKMYIDAPVNGSLTRTLLNPDITWADIINAPDFPTVEYHTTAEWATAGLEISEAGAIYVYSDASTDINGNSIPGIKVGDGSAYIVDLPFINQIEIDHLNDTVVHITAAERDFWNNKVRTYYSAVEDDTLVFTTH